MDKLFLGKKLVAIRVRRFSDGVVPLSPPGEALQLMTMKRPQGHIARLHRHVPKKRVTRILQECLIVVRGKIRYDLYDARGRRARSITARAGQAILILGGAHEVRFLEDSLVYELKNGPYMSDKEFL